MTIKPAASHTLALALFNDRKFEQALEVYKELITLNENDAQAWHMAGAIEGISGDYLSAKHYCEQAVRINPQAHGPRVNLANILQSLGDLQGALHQFRLALDILPGDPQTRTCIAILQTRLGDFKVAESGLQSVIRDIPGFPDAYNALGNVYREIARADSAILCYRQAINIKPDYIDAICNLGAVLSGQLKFEDSESCYSAALRHSPGNAAALHGLGDLYQSTGEYDKARTCYQQALSNNPTDNGLLSSLATLDERSGELESITALLTPFIQTGEFTPEAAIVYGKLCSKNGQLEKGIQVLEDTGKATKSPGKVIDIYFLLGNLHDQSCNYDKAFYYIKKANDMDARATSPVDYSSGVKRMSNYYNSQRWPTLPRSGNRSELPVFIVGMPRSGTSLVEQILASHSLVSAGGERGDIFNILDTLSTAATKGSGMQDPLDTLTTDLLNKLAHDYIGSIASRSEGCLRFTDKTPLHGILLGFINQLLPGSRVIICNRDPMDTCLSIYFNRFNAFHGYATGLESLGHFYREYDKLMDHWMNILDIRILKLQYEELVRNPEQAIRNILDFCGLDWDEKCLAFHENKRTVNTPSYNQVRRPIYTNSIQRWKHYARHLDPLRAALRQD